MKITLPKRKLKKGEIFRVQLFSVFLIFWDFSNSVLRHQKVQRSQKNLFWIFFSKKNYLYEFVFSNVFFRKKLKFWKIISFEKKNQYQKAPWSFLILILIDIDIKKKYVSAETYFFLKRKLPKRSTKKIFFDKNLLKKILFETTFPS